MTKAIVVSGISVRAVGIAIAIFADIVLADPRRLHPVAGFGFAAAQLEQLTYRDSKTAGFGHVTALLSTVGLAAMTASRAARIHNPVSSSIALAAATWVSLGGTSLARAGLAIADDLDSRDIAGIDRARALLPSLCGRDPAQLDHAGLTRAALESIAENTSDAQVAPLLWAALGGVPGVLVYRAVNTLDAMIGHRSPRYDRFGWAAARLDDIANYLPARLAGVLVVGCAPLVGGSPAGAWRAWRRDAAAHPSPNAGVVEAAFAGALGVRLGGPTRYHHELQIRPTLGDGRPAAVADLRRAVRLSRIVQAAAAVTVLALVSVAGRIGRRVSPRP